MSDVKVIRYLLATSAGLTAVVPSARILAGRVPQGTTLPALCVQHVSTVRRHAVAATAVKLCTARVQVTVYASTYVQQKEIMTLVRAALPQTRGTVNGVEVDSIHHELDGPDFDDDTTEIYMESVDYKVTFHE